MQEIKQTKIQIIKEMISENTPREQQTMERFIFMREASLLLLRFFEKGVKTPNSLLVLLGVYGFKFDSVRMTHFFNFKIKDAEIMQALQECLTKIESHESDQSS